MKNQIKVMEQGWAFTPRACVTAIALALAAGAKTIWLE
jgi:hypothetical protein